MASSPSWAMSESEVKQEPSGSMSTPTGMSLSCERTGEDLPIKQEIDPRKRKIESVRERERERGLYAVTWWWWVNEILQRQRERGQTACTVGGLKETEQSKSNHRQY